MRSFYLLLAITVAAIGVTGANVLDVILRRTEPAAVVEEVREENVDHKEEEQHIAHPPSHHHQQQLYQPIYYQPGDGSGYYQQQGGYNHHQQGGYNHQHNRPYYQDNVYDYQGGPHHGAMDHHNQNHHNHHDDSQHHQSQGVTKTVYTLPQLPTLAIPPLPGITLPSWPLPSLPRPTRPTATAYKTIYLETTKKVARHAVCMMTKTPLKPCVTLPKPNHHYDGKPELHHEDDEDLSHLHEHHAKIQPSNVASLPEVQETRLVGEVTESEARESEYYDDLNEAEEGEETGRSAKYLIPHPMKNTQPLDKIGGEIRSDQSSHYSDHNQEVTVVNELRPPPLQSVVNMLVPKVTVTATKTLWVTKVQPIYDHTVTATLVAENCLPSYAGIPYCYDHHHEDPHIPNLV